MLPLKTAHQHAGTVDERQNAAAVLATRYSGWIRLEAGLQLSKLLALNRTLKVAAWLSAMW
jgi:hypothetical protein